MVQFLMGAAFGILVYMVAGMVGYCIYTEHMHPEIVDRLREERKETEVAR